MTPPNNFLDVIRLFMNIINILIPIVAALSLLSFFWGLTKFIGKAGEKDHSDGKNLMIWGTIALFVMFSVFGIIRLFYNDLGFENTARPGSFLPLLPE